MKPQTLWHRTEGKLLLLSISAALGATSLWAKSVTAFLNFKDKWSQTRNDMQYKNLLQLALLLNQLYQRCMWKHVWLVAIVMIVKSWQVFLSQIANFASTV